MPCQHMLCEGTPAIRISGSLINHMGKIRNALPGRNHISDAIKPCDQFRPRQSRQNWFRRIRHHNPDPLLALAQFSEPANMSGMHWIEVAHKHFQRRCAFRHPINNF